MIWSMIIISSHKRKQITSAPPGVFPWLFCVHWTPPRENLAKYDVCTLAGSNSDNQVFITTKKKSTPYSWG